MKTTLIFALTFILFPVAIYPTEFYVSPQGSDTNPGTREQPFASLQQAQNAVRAQVPTREPITIFLRAGIYFLDKPIEFSAKDSGDRSARITYAGYPGEEVVLSGGLPLSCQWKEYRGGILQTQLDDNAIDIDQLWIDGECYRMARYPNYDPQAKFFGGTSSEAISPKRVKTWSNPVSGYMHALHEALWGSKHYRIVGVSDDGTPSFQGGWQENRGGGFDPFFRGGYHPDFLFVENIFEELDAPGEWYLDRENKVLYVKPQTGVDLSQAKIIGSRLKELIVVQGSTKQPVRHIAFKNLRFKHTARIFMEPYERLLRGDWSIARIAAVRFHGVEDSAIEDCSFEEIGGNGVFLDGYNRRIAITGCEFNRLGESGVCVVGELKAVRSPAIEYSQTRPQDEIDPIPGPQSPDYPLQCTIDNNLMHNFGLVGKQVAGVFLSMSEEITVRNNTIYDCPRAAICINDGCWGGHIIEFNDVFHTVRESGDHGPFNSWGRDRFWKTSYNGGQDIEPFAKGRATLDAYKTTHIRNNRFAHDSGHSWGIDLDDGSSNYHVYNNLCLGMGVKLREGFFRRVENNIFINGFGGFHIWLPGCDDVIARNIFISDEPYQFIRANPEYAQEIDYNLFYNPGSIPKVTGVGDTMSIIEWQAKGFDTHSQIADPLFIDPDQGDFRVKPESPALKLGFVNFPMNRFGVTKLEFQRKAASARKPSETTAERSNPEKERLPETTQWLGATIKNLIGEAEKSAAGMGRETGVLFVEVPPDSQAAQIGFKIGDVIIRLDEEAVDSIQDWMRLRDAYRGKRIPLTVFNAVERILTLEMQ